MALCAMTERCCRSTLWGSLMGIGTAPTPLRQAFGLPPPLKGRLWVDAHAFGIVVLIVSEHIAQSVGRSLSKTLYFSWEKSYTKLGFFAILGV